MYFLCILYSSLFLALNVSDAIAPILRSYGSKLQLELLRMGAIAPETCRVKK
jgi:hypothetical protein